MRGTSTEPDKGLSWPWDQRQSQPAASPRRPSLHFCWPLCSYSKATLTSLRHQLFCLQSAPPPPNQFMLSEMQIWCYCFAQKSFIDLIHLGYSERFSRTSFPLGPLDTFSFLELIVPFISLDFYSFFKTQTSLCERSLLWPMCSIPLGAPSLLLVHNTAILCILF